MLLSPTLKRLSESLALPHTRGEGPFKLVTQDGLVDAYMSASVRPSATCGRATKMSRHEAQMAILALGYGGGTKTEEPYGPSMIKRIFAGRGVEGPLVKVH